MDGRNAAARPIIAWDWNGTILDDLDLCVSCMNEMLARRGMRKIGSRDEYRSLFRFPVEDYYRAVGWDLDAIPFPVLADEFIALYQEASLACPLVPNAKAALEIARGRGYRQILLSASRAENLAQQVRSFGVSEFFDHVLGTGDVLARSKLAVARSWATSNGIDPALVTLIGDSLHDLEVARDLGWDCVLYAGGHQPIPAPADGSYQLVHDLAELGEIL